MAVETGLLPDRYTGPQPIGRGGMGEIYRATDTALGRAVAVKVLAERYSLDAAVRERFTREALAAARLSGNPNIVTIFDVGEHDGRPFIVMEYLAGGSLEQRLRADGAEPPCSALDWLEQAASRARRGAPGGRRAPRREAGQPPARPHGGVHVADFGIASAAGLGSLTQTGTVLGTASYLSPEQAKGERTTPRATATRSPSSPSSCSPATGRSRPTASPPRRPRTSPACAVGLRRQPGRAVRARPGLREGAREGSRRPVRELRRVRRSAPACAPGRRRRDADHRAAAGCRSRTRDDLPAAPGAGVAPPARRPARAARDRRRDRRGDARRRRQQRRRGTAGLGEDGHAAGHDGAADRDRRRRRRPRRRHRHDGGAAPRRARAATRSTRRLTADASAATTPARCRCSNRRCRRCRADRRHQQRLRELQPRRHADRWAAAPTPCRISRRRRQLEPGRHEVDRGDEARRSGAASYTAVESASRSAYCRS